MFIMDVITHPCPTFKVGLAGAKAGMSNHITYTYVDAITYPYPNPMLL